MSALRVHLVDGTSELFPSMVVSGPTRMRPALLGRRLPRHGGTDGQNHHPDPAAQRRSRPVPACCVRLVVSIPRWVSQKPPLSRETP
jgi:hypothetical protein